jgi:hypothetical protein
MTVGATHPPLGDRVMARQTELAPHVGMTLETDVFLRTLRIHSEASTETAGGGAAGRETERGLDLATGLGMKTARTVTRFTARAEGIRTLGD